MGTGWSFVGLRVDSRLRGNGKRGRGNAIGDARMTRRVFIDIATVRLLTPSLAMTEADSSFDRLRTNGSMKLRTNGKAESRHD